MQFLAWLRNGGGVLDNLKRLLRKGWLRFATKLGRAVDKEKFDSGTSKCGSSYLDTVAQHVAEKITR